MKTSEAGAPRSAAIQLSGVNKRFAIRRKETLTALSNVSASIGHGEFIALLGPSGCGKSTLLRIISGLEDPTEGSVEVEGQPPARLIAEHRLGFAFQEHALLPWATVAENIALPFRLAKIRVDDARVRELVELVGLTGFENARPKQLSGGMRQRVAIARSLALRPDLLLLDEPFGALDEITRRRLNFELARIWAETGVTTVMVTHSVDEALLLADRVIVMGTRPGRILTEVEIDLPRPRTVESMATNRFAELSTQLVRLLDQDNNAKVKP
ncbi:ABC transporter ATP-binding protein [Arthrobacter sp. B2a2-09]|nr:ABC transporter ATP-binding protein [Arthrobacter sp. B2a2-09]